MRVERCRACGARLEGEAREVGDGTCPRCGVSLRSAARHPVSIALLLAGLLLLGALFLWRPHALKAGLGLPWKTGYHWAQNLAFTVGTALWALLGVWTTLTALIPGARFRSVLTLALGVLVLVLATTDAGAGFPIVAARDLPWMVAAVALGAGVTLTIRGRRGGASNALLVAGGLWILVGYVATWNAADANRLVQIWSTARQFFAGGAVSKAAFLETAVAPAAMIVAALGGLLLVFARARPLAIGIGVVLVLAVLLPGAVRFGRAFDGADAWGHAGRMLVSGFGAALVRDGVALWLVLLYAVVDLACARGARA